MGPPKCSPLRQVLLCLDDLMLFTISNEHFSHFVEADFAVPVCILLRDHDHKFLLRQHVPERSKQQAQLLRVNPFVAVFVELFEKFLQLVFEKAIVDLRETFGSTKFLPLQSATR